MNAYSRGYFLSQPVCGIPGKADPGSCEEHGNVHSDANSACEANPPRLNPEAAWAHLARAEQHVTAAPNHKASLPAGYGEKEAWSMKIADELASLDVRSSTFLIKISK